MGRLSITEYAEVSHNSVVARGLTSIDITLIINLLISDVVQSFGFLIDFFWYQKKALGVSRAACLAQGLFIQTGDAATAFFVILIALHTLKHFVTPTNPRLPPRYLKIIIGCAWILAIVMAIVPRLIRHDFYANAGVWCWISSKYLWSRLYLHYIFLFMGEFVSISVYGGLGIYLWFYSNTIKSQDLKRVAKMMFTYPIAYTMGTLPLACARLQVMAGREVSLDHLIGACIIFSSLGGINCALYVLTRRTMMKRERDLRAKVDRSGPIVVGPNVSNISYLSPDDIDLLQEMDYDLTFQTTGDGTDKKVVVQAPVELEV